MRFSFNESLTISQYFYFAMSKSAKPNGGRKKSLNPVGIRPIQSFFSPPVHVVAVKELETSIEVTTESKLSYLYDNTENNVGKVSIVVTPPSDILNQKEKKPDIDDPKDTTSDSTTQEDSKRTENIPRSESFVDLSLDEAVGKVDVDVNVQTDKQEVLDLTEQERHSPITANHDAGGEDSSAGPMGRSKRKRIPVEFFEPKSFIRGKQSTVEKIGENPSDIDGAVEMKPRKATVKPVNTFFMSKVKLFYVLIRTSWGIERSVYCFKLAYCNV